MSQLKRTLTLLLTLALTLGLLSAPAAADEGYRDTHGHWAEAAIDRWSGYGVVEGSGGAFKPDAGMTRGELAKTLSCLLGLTEATAENPFSDVPATEWYAPYMLRCHAAGILLGAGGKGKPNAPVSREEALTLIARALELEPADTAALDGYKDAGGVSDWAAGYVAALAAAGVVGGVGNAALAPGNNIDRASVMTVFDKAIAQYVNASGSYELTDRDGVVLIAAGGVTLTGTTRADVLISHAADGKEVNFDKAAVSGRLVVQADNAKISASADSTLPAPAMRGTSSVYAEAAAVSSGGGGSSSAPSAPAPAPSPSAPSTPAPAPSPSAPSTPEPAPHTHVWNAGVVTTPATCVSSGVKTYTCTGCGATRLEAVPAFGHDYAEAWSHDDAKHWHACSHDATHHGGEAAHVWDGGAVTTEATAGEDGVKTYACTVCGATKTEPIPATGLYAVTLATPANGTLTAPSTQKAGTELTVTLAAAEGYVCTAVTFSYDGEDFPLPDGSFDKTSRTATATFVMPSADVVVRATFLPWLEARLEAGGTVTLDRDVAVDSLTMNSGTAILDLNGHSLDLDFGEFLINSGATLTIRGSGTISTLGSCGIRNRGDLTVEGGAVTSFGIPLSQEANTVRITGGSFSSELSNMNALLVTGGAVFISGGTFCSDPSAYVDPATHEAVKSGKVWTVTAKAQG
ncbi:MAG: S-layer homology domain-containing protein [Oscillospiraceae bacterium]|nr:S-layer homology domain-containing protein [Oscillospiraceae bacterium]